MYKKKPLNVRGRKKGERSAYQGWVGKTVSVAAVKSLTPPAGTSLSPRQTSVSIEPSGCDGCPTHTETKKRH